MYYKRNFSKNTFFYIRDCDSGSTRLRTVFNIRWVPVGGTGRPTHVSDVLTGTEGTRSRMDYVQTSGSF